MNLHRTKNTLLKNFLLIANEIFIGRQKCSFVLEVDKFKIVDFFSQFFISDFIGVLIIRKHSLEVFLLDQVELFIEFIEEFFLNVLILHMTIHLMTDIDLYINDSFL